MTREPRADLVDDIRALLPTMVQDILRLVRCESPSADRAAVDRSADEVAAVGARVLGADPVREERDGTVHLLWSFGRPRVLLLGHHDTVWPVGTLSTHPAQVTDGILRGPGCFDMKTGVVMAFYALAQARSREGAALLITGDEEVGSRTSRSLIEECAAGCDAALVLEASANDGALKIARKGVATYEATITGRAAHAGLEPEKGVNAAIELAHQILAVAALADPEMGTTVVPTVAAAGTTTNTVAAAARFAVDSRAWTEAEQLRVDAMMRALTSRAGAQIEVSGGPNRPPLDAGSSAQLCARVQVLAEALGLGVVPTASVGGGSDGNFTAGIGIPTLDGLGAVGGGAHAADEHVIVDAIPARTALVTALIDDILSTAGEQDDGRD